jgi:hypothetical protein
MSSGSDTEFSSSGAVLGKRIKATLVLVRTEDADIVRECRTEAAI